uniref:Uncharacterized protein n=1 Tax=Klebsiella pneumoniae TaxID=573 RepID=A0A2P1BNS5_KLEPN|nr:hypothetical protein [Klebsiella pneumoniae]
MYFVPLFFLAFHWLSGNGFAGVLIAELAFGLNMPLKKLPEIFKPQPSTENKMKEGEPDVHP